MPLEDTLEASLLKCGNTGPFPGASLATFATVSTTTDDVSCAPTSATFESPT